MAKNSFDAPAHRDRSGSRDRDRDRDRRRILQNIFERYPVDNSKSLTISPLRQTVNTTRVNVNHIGNVPHTHTSTKFQGAFFSSLIFQIYIATVFDVVSIY